MVFVPASEKGDESDYTTLISITEKLTGLKIETISKLQITTQLLRQ